MGSDDMKTPPTSRGKCHLDHIVVVVVVFHFSQSNSLTVTASCKGLGPPIARSREGGEGGEAFIRRRSRVCPKAQP